MALELLLNQTGLVPRLSPLRRGRAWYIYHMHDTKSRRGLIMWGWSKLVAMHIQAKVFSRLLQFSFWVNMALVAISDGESHT